MLNFVTIMAERESGKPLQFRPAATLLDLYNSYFRSDLGPEGQLVSLDEAHDWWPRDIDREFLKQWLFRIWAATQNQSDKWAEEKFRQLRIARKEWSLDGMWVDKSGEIVGNALWSTYDIFANNFTHLFSMEYLVQSIARGGRLVFPMSPMFATTLFFNAADAEKIVPVITRNTNAEPPIEEYPSQIGNVVLMTRVRRETLGAGKFGQAQVLLGKLGFWEARRLALGEFGTGAFSPRVSFADSKLLEGSRFISPHSEEEVRAKGGQLMSEKYENVSVDRLDPEKARVDFIAASLELAASYPHPTVLSYTTPRLWSGEGPKHRGG